MKKISYEITCVIPKLYYRLLILTETYDEITKTGGMGFDVIYSGSKAECMKRKEELEHEKNN